MTGLTFITIMTGGLLYYYFVLRKYNSLGFRLFSLFTFITSTFCYWLYEDTQIQKSILKNGRTVNGIVLAKEKKTQAGSSSPDNVVTVRLSLQALKTDTFQVYKYTSAEEWERFKIGSTIPLIYDVGKNNLFIKESYHRMLNDQWVLYVVAAVFFLIGVCCWYFLRNYKVGVDGAGNEWVEKDGKIYLDERKSPASQALKGGNIVSKLLQALSK
ncbi:MAG: hypothetical protein U0X91_01635 [Spirosomataceae bacterium]